jgi:bifunctional DNase/RNase
MPENNGRITVYSAEDMTELQRMHRDNYKEIHNLTRNIFDKCTDKIIRKHIVDILDFVYAKELECQKDINIEASDCESNNASN